jgi:hypothetical protein
MPTTKELAEEAVIGELVSGSHFPVSRGKYRETLALKATHGDVALAFPNKFKTFPLNSLTIGTGNFGD